METSRQEMREAYLCLRGEVVSASKRFPNEPSDLGKLDSVAQGLGIKTGPETGIEDRKGG